MRPETSGRGRAAQKGTATTANDVTDAMNARTDAQTRRGAIPLDELPHGTQARVVSVEGEGAVALRLMEMGVVPGAPVRVIKAAPLGDPFEVRVHGYHLALRRSEAETILVTYER
jgi:ferrous iron transport protein A